MSAIDNQVGGDHYKFDYQPIMFIEDMNLNFIQGNILKYATRFKLKNGKEDLMKALHYCDLGVEMNFKAHFDFNVTLANRYVEENDTEFDIEFLESLCGCEYLKCKKIIIEMIEHNYMKLINADALDKFYGYIGHKIREIKTQIKCYQIGDFCYYDCEEVRNLLKPKAKELFDEFMERNPFQINEIHNNK